MVLPSTSPMRAWKIIGRPDFIANRMERLPGSRESPRTPQAAIPPALAAAARDTSGAAGLKPESVAIGSQLRRLAGSTQINDLVQHIDWFNMASPAPDGENPRTQLLS